MVAQKQRPHSKLDQPDLPQLRKLSLLTYPFLRYSLLCAKEYRPAFYYFLSTFHWLTVSVVLPKKTLLTTQIKCLRQSLILQLETICQDSKESHHQRISISEHLMWQSFQVDLTQLVQTDLSLYGLYHPCSMLCLQRRTFTERLVAAHFAQLSSFSCAF